MHAQGDIDELNSFIGLLASRVADSTLQHLINTIQHHLFNIGAELSMAQPIVNTEAVAFLEQQLDHYNANLSPLKEFILPGGGDHQ